MKKEIKVKDGRAYLHTEITDSRGIKYIAVYPLGNDLNRIKRFVEINSVED